MKFRPWPFPRQCENRGPVSFETRITADANKGIVPAGENMVPPSPGGAIRSDNDHPLPLVSPSPNSSDGWIDSSNAGAAGHIP